MEDQITKIHRRPRRNWYMGHVGGKDGAGLFLKMKSRHIFNSPVRINIFLENFVIYFIKTISLKIEV